MKRLFLFLMLLGAFPLFAQKFAVINLEKIWGNVNEIKREKKKWEAQLKKSGEIIQKKRQELIELFKKYQQDAKMASPEARNALEQDLQQRQIKLQQLIAEHQRKLAEMDKKVQEKFLSKVKKVAQEVAKRKGFDFVFVSDSLIVYDKNIDITDDVIKTYNKRYK